MTITKDMDLRNLVGAARNQGMRPTCLVFAVTAAHEACRTATEYLCIEHLYFRGVQRSHRNPRLGLSTAAASSALKDDGQPIEEAWPYRERLDDVNTWAPPDTTHPFHKASVAFSPRSVAEVRDVMRQGSPVLLIVSVTTAMYVPDKDHIVRPGASDTRTASRHALLAVGSGHAADGRYVLVRNSWGLSWGEQGHAWLPDTYLAAQLRGTGVIDREEQDQ